MRLEMDSSSKMVFYFLACYILVNFAVEACHNAQHTAPTPGMDISGRKRRNVGCVKCTADVDERLSLFFTGCMERKHPGEFSSWRSVVDFVIRDTNWYHATNNDFCSGRKDSTKCWQRRVQYMLQYGSILVNGTKECIGEFDRSVKDEYGADFEAYFVKYYDMYDYDLSDGEFKRTERSIADYEVNKSVAIVQTDVATEIAQSCPLYDTFSYVRCLQADFSVLEESLLSEYPSLQYVNVASNNQFVQRHFSSCRITTQEIGGQVMYQENCPVTSSATATVGMQYAHADIPRIHSCLIFTYIEIVNKFSPTYSIYSTCEQQVGDKRSTIPSVTSANTTIATTSYPVNAENLFYNFQVKQRIGSCRKGGKWSSYYSIDSPDEGEGDMETLEDLRKYFENQICQNPMAVEARIRQGNRGDTVSISLTDGLRCINNMQSGGTCADYKVRFCCQRKQPECTGNNTWTEWLDRDIPRRGEDESLQKHLAEGNACPQPTSIRARIKRSQRPYWKGKNVLKISPTHGLTCKRDDQIRRRFCKNYEVSFCCPI